MPESLFIKKETQHSCFPVNFAKFLRIPFLQNTSGRLLLRSSIENEVALKIKAKSSGGYFQLIVFFSCGEGHV